MISEHFTNIRLVRPGDVDAIIAAAQGDEHAAVAPTHLVSKGKEVVGYLSVGAMPLVFWWLHSKKGTVRDTVQMANFFENQLAAVGARNVIVPVPAGSPYMKLMSKAGYSAFGQNVLFHKTIGG